MTKRIRIRMYRVGFGDCFLITFPPLRSGGSESHVLIDCGVHSAGSLGNIQKVVENVGEVTGGKLAVVVASHAHQDHIFGFAKCEETFDEFDIGEVWLPWTECEKDERVQEIERKVTAVVQRLEQHFNATKAKGLSTNEDALWAIANLSSNARALQNLRAGFAGRADVKYLRAGDLLKAPAGCTGLTVEVLGPPEDEDFLKKMHPPKAERYLHLNESGELVPHDPIRPFGRWWTKTPSQAAADERFPPAMVIIDAEREDLRQQLTEHFFDSLAFSLDQARNNTSLVLLFRFGGKTLLFPGDAQYGNWKWWLDQPTSGDILGELNFIKIAHHGSHNASPKTAVQGLRRGVGAMVSTQNKPWESIPRKPLMDELERVTNKRILRSDSIDLPEAPKGPVVGKLPKDFSKGIFWYDLAV